MVKSLTRVAPIDVNACVHARIFLSYCIIVNYFYYCAKLIF